MSDSFKAFNYNFDATIGGGFSGLRSSTQLSYLYVLNKYCSFHDLDLAVQDQSFYADALISRYFFALGEEYNYHSSAEKTHGAALNLMSCHFGNSNFRLFPHEWPLTKEVFSVS